MYHLSSAVLHSVLDRFGDLGAAHDSVAVPVPPAAQRGREQEAPRLPRGLREDQSGGDRRGRAKRCLLQGHRAEGHYDLRPAGHRLCE